MNPETKPTKVFDLEDRTFRYAKDVRLFLKKSKSNPFSFEDRKQLLRSSGSVGANYIEANESISSKDFFLRIKICRKEAKESFYWLRLMADEVEEENKSALDYLIRESLELAKIFGTIVNKNRQ